MSETQSAATLLGLTSAQASRLLAENGPNHLPVQRATPAWRRFGAELVHFFAVLFWVAGALAFVAGLPQLGIAIFLVVVLNAVFAFVQEQRAEHAAEKLREMLPRWASVVRDGVRRQIPTEELVVGDVVLLSEGDRISADAVLDTVLGLQVDTSTLTGESLPERPDVGGEVFAGCFVIEGEGRARVTAIGAQTKLAGIARLTQLQHRPATPLRRELTRVSRILAAVAIAVGVVFFGIALLVGIPASAGFLFAIGVTVAVVPEGLLPTVTLSLAVGAQRMAQKNALVRHLEAVETLGSTTFICTDKTGTLTQNEMSVVEVWTPLGGAAIEGQGYQPDAEIRCDSTDVEEQLRVVARAAVLCSTGRAIVRDGDWVAQGDPMEAALDAFSRRVGAPVSDRENRDRVQFPFDPRRRRMSVVTAGEILVKGAPDGVLPLCTPVPGASEALDTLTRRGLRVLAIAGRRLGEGEALPADATAAERNLTLLGLAALEDPPRPHATGTVEVCRRAGIRVAMLTGDHRETAAAIAREVGLLTSDGLLLQGGDLPEDLDRLGQLLDRDGVVVARVTPEDKLRIAQALGRRGHVVAMTGDGVNDAPALREAAVGVAMGKGGTDVAREAADLVLLDDDFGTIVAAVEEGRATFANIRRFLTYHLTDNVAELAPFIVWGLTAGWFPLAIGVLQVLALDIGTDVLPSLALGSEPPDKRVLHQPPVRGHLLDRKVLVRAFGVLGPVEASFALAAFSISLLAAGWRPGADFPDAAMLAASGAAFSAIVLGQAANAFACRSATQPAWAIRERQNRFLIVAVAAELALLVVLLYLPPAAHLLEHSGPTVAGAAVALLTVPAVLLADAVHKRFQRTGSAER